jgi:hypothetical protein
VTPLAVGQPRAIRTVKHSVVLSLQMYWYHSLSLHVREAAEQWIGNLIWKPESADMCPVVKRVHVTSTRNKYGT